LTFPRSFPRVTFIEVIDIYISIPALGEAYNRRKGYDLVDELKHCRKCFMLSELLKISNAQRNIIVVES
jgi:hypothetical protein